MKLFRFIGDIFNVLYRARRIREDEERRQKSVIFAVTSIVYSLVMFVTVCLGVFVFSNAEQGGLLAIFIFVIGIILIIGGALGFIGALLRVIAQFTINRKAMSWIALIVFIASLVASIVVALQI